MNEIRDDLIRTVDRLCEEFCSAQLRTEAESGTWPAQLWNALEEVGLDKAALPESAGGVGLDFEDAMAVLEQVAWHAAPVPLAETMLAGRLLASAGLPVPDGPITVVPNRQVLTADRNNVVSGVLHRVPWGDQCPHIVAVVDRGGETSLVLLRTQDAGQVVEKNIAGEPRVRLEFKSAPALQLALFPGGMDVVQAEGALYRSVQMTGALRRILEESIQYANDRVQFGKPIGKFQAVQHMLALLAGHSAAASAASHAAVDACRGEIDTFAVAVAKARAGEASGKGAEIAHQVHAAMGFTREHNLHFSTRRLWSWRDEFGNERYWQSWLGRLVASEGADALWPMLTAGAVSAKA